MTDKQSTSTLARILFEPEQSRADSLASSILLVAEWLCGAWVWLGVILNFGRFSLVPCDWLQQKMYGRIIGLSLRLGALPLHINSSVHSTNRFLAIPEINILPQALLLRWVTVQQFILIDTFVMYTLCFASCVLIKRRFRLSHIAFLPLFLVCAFNGNLVAHTVAGHEWSGAFLLPAFVLSVFTLAQPNCSRRWIATLALVMAAMGLAGTIHCFVWCSMVLLLIVCTNWKSFPRYLGAWLLSISMLIGRFLPAAMSVGLRPFRMGYPSPVELVTSITTSNPDFASQSGWSAPWIWEADNYLGIAALLMIVCLLFRKKPDRADHYLRLVALPMVVLLVLSMNRLYYPVYCSGIPMFSAEREPARFLIMPIVFLITIASMNLQDLLDRHKNTVVRICSAFVVLIISAQLFHHALTWAIPNVAGCRADQMGCEAITSIVQCDDPGYILALILGWAISLVATLITVFLFIKAKEPPTNIIPEPASED